MTSKPTGSKARARRVTLWKMAATLTALSAAGCTARLEHESQAAERPARVPVTVARVTHATVTEYSEHTGHTEAPNAVEIRVRATGYLTRATFHEGDRVKKGDLLFEIDPKPYQAAQAQARAALDSAEVDRELSRKNAARATALFQASVISEEERDTRDASFHQLEARTEVAKAALASATLDLSYTSVRSPIDGRIGRILVTPGNLVGPSMASPLATVVSIDPLYVYVDVDETRALRLNGTGTVAHVGLAGEDGCPHEARLDFLDNRVDPQTGMLKVRLTLPNPDGRWVHGLFARVELPESAAHDALLIADPALATDQDRRFVWVVGADGKVEPRRVKLGPLSGGLRVVREGLKASERVVVRGLQRVHPGALVAAQEIPMLEALHSELAAGATP